MRNLFGKVETLFNKIKLPDYSVFSFFAIITGAAAGLAAVLFHDSIDLLNKTLFEDGNSFFKGKEWLVIFIPALGMLIQALMIWRFPKVSKKKGVAEVIKAVALRGGYINFRTTLFHFIAPVISIGTGGTVGPEGPAAQIGGGIGSKLGNIFGLSDSRVRIFTAAGAGAAISAIFNTPLGGIFFALEVVLLNDFQTPTFSALILASVTASAIARVLVGNESIFVFQHIPFNDYANLYIYAIFGILMGIISIAFIRYSEITEHLFSKKILKAVPQWIAMTLVGLAVGLAGYFYKEIFGIGYYAINEFLSGGIAWQIVLVLVILKFVLVPLVLYSGGFGGLFAPSLFIGGGAGYLFALLMNNIWGFELNT
ncbi:MAG: chloride channel protein, partial [Ignavibacteria bacterium]